MSNIGPVFIVVAMAAIAMFLVAVVSVRSTEVTGTKMAATITSIIATGDLADDGVRGMNPTWLVALDGVSKVCRVHYQGKSVTAGRQYVVYSRGYLCGEYYMYDAEQEKPPTAHDRSHGNVPSNRPEPGRN